MIIYLKELKILYLILGPVLIAYCLNCGDFNVSNFFHALYIHLLSTFFSSVVSNSSNILYLILGPVFSA
jgi:hypothetical protein